MTKAFTNLSWLELILPRAAMDLLFDSAGLQLPDPSKEGDSLLSQSGPTSFHDANSHSETSWVPNRRESDSPSPPDADPTYAVDTLSPTSLGILRRLRSLLLPLVAIAYTTFCYIVHFKTIPVRSGGLFDDTSNNIGRYTISSPPNECL